MSKEGISDKKSLIQNIPLTGRTFQNRDSIPSYVSLGRHDDTTAFYWVLKSIDDNVYKVVIAKKTRFDKTLEQYEKPPITTEYITLERINVKYPFLMYMCIRNPRPEYSDDVEDPTDPFTERIILSPLSTTPRRKKLCIQCMMMFIPAIIIIGVFTYLYN